SSTPAASSAWCATTSTRAARPSATTTRSTGCSPRRTTCAISVSTSGAGVEQRELTPGLMAVLAVAIFGGASTIHYQTPMLGAMAQEFGADASAIGWVATLSFGGFLAGFVFLVPLGDRMDKRRLILAQFWGAIAALLASAAAPNVAILAAAAFLTGLCACFSQNIVPLVAELARAEERGRMIG